MEEAVNAARDGDTIVLGEGKFTLYKKGADTKGKDLTFVGQGADKTTWGIGATLPDPAYFGTEYNGDYSFDGSGTITFRNMTLQSGSADYLGFIRADKTVVEDCMINGKTFYWGYSSAIFRNTTFFCPNGDYALWTYSSPEMTFDSCTFNSSGKTINVYTDFSAAKHDITVNFKDCTVNSEVAIKNVLNINDSNMGDYKYRIHISGNNSINGPVYRDKVTCSRWFGFGGKTANNTGRSVVTFDGITVFQNGKMVDHDELHPEYTDGYKDNAYTVTTTEWVKAEDGTHYTRSVKKVCDYCGYDAETEETGYSVTYNDGVDSAEIFADQSTVVPKNAETPEFNGTPAREGYVFSGWAPEKAGSVTQNATYVATWKTDANGNGKADEDEEKYTVTKDVTYVAQWKSNSGKDNVPKTGDNGIVPVLGSVLLFSFCGAAACVFDRKRKHM